MWFLSVTYSIVFLIICTVFVYYHFFAGLLLCSLIYSVCLYSYYPKHYFSFVFCSRFPSVAFTWFCFLFFIKSLLTDTSAWSVCPYRIVAGRNQRILLPSNRRLEVLLLMPKKLLMKSLNARKRNVILYSTVIRRQSPLRISINWL